MKNVIILEKVREKKLSEGFADTITLTKIAWASNLVDLI